jgi:hypothetical protein
MHRTMKWNIATGIRASLVWGKDASPFNLRRLRPHQAKVRSTRHRFGRRRQPLAPSGRWTIARRTLRQGRQAHIQAMKSLADA